MKSLRLSLAFAVGLLTALPTANVFADDYTVDKFRIKIDSVDVSKAPDIQIRATFLDDMSHPIEPDDNITIDIYDHDEQLKLKPRLSSYYEDKSRPLDLAFVIPITERFNEKDLAKIKGDVRKILGKAREKDRVAGFFDDGRSIHTTELTNADAVGEQLDGVTPRTDASFLYASLDMALECLSDSSTYRPEARRAIILVTDAFDTYTYRADDVQQMINEKFHFAHDNDIKIYVIMYQPFIPSLIPIFEGLSRKTGGTYRYASSINKIPDAITNTWGEIYAEMIIDFKHPGLEEGTQVMYKLEATAPGGVHVKSGPSKGYRIEKLRFNWKLFGIVMGVIFGILIIILIVFLIYRRHLKKLEEEEAARKEQEIQEGIERGEFCPKCRRKMMPDWKECMFCAREAAEEQNRAKAESRQKAIAEAEKKGVRLEARVCSKCGRTLMPQWNECLFCKAGIGGSAGPKAGVAPMRSAKDKKDNAPEARLCPVCGKPMKPHWTTCLYCEADSANKVVKKQEEKQPEQPQERVCPDCGRPMKAHWTTCLYCEANRDRA